MIIRANPTWLKNMQTRSFLGNRIKWLIRIKKNKSIGLYNARSASYSGAYWNETFSRNINFAKLKIPHKL